MNENESTVRIVITEERLEELPVKIYRLMKKDPDYALQFAAFCMVGDDGQYLAFDQALAILDDLTMRQLGEVLDSIQTTMEDVAVPKQ